MPFLFSAEDGGFFRPAEEPVPPGTSVVDETGGNTVLDEAGGNTVIVK